MDRGIHFTDKQGNEYFVMVRETKVEVWRNKEQIHDVRFYDDELTEVPLKQGYFVEVNGEFYQSVFPENEAEKSQLHTDLSDALDYMILECGVKEEEITLSL